MDIKKELELMITRFPNHKAKIIQLYHNDSNFKSLCEDLCLCHSMLVQQKSMDPSDLVIQSEYSSMCFLLERELEEFLKIT